MTDKCKDCPVRKFHAQFFDMHFWGEDCPFVCDRDTTPKEDAE